MVRGITIVWFILLSSFVHHAVAVYTLCKWGIVQEIGFPYVTVWITFNVWKHISVFLSYSSTEQYFIWIQV
jgi:hypothetical protein